MGTIIRDLTKDYKSNAKSWYDNIFKILVPITGTNVNFYSSYLRNRAAYKQGINLTATKLKVCLAVPGYLGNETTESHLFSGYDYENKIKLDVFMQKESSSSFNVLFKIVYSTSAETTIFSYLCPASSATDLAFHVFEFEIDTTALTAVGNYYSRNNAEQAITHFVFTKTEGTVISFVSTKSMACIGTDAVTLPLKFSEYGRIIGIAVFSDETPVFNVVFGPFFSRGTVIENVSKETLAIMGPFASFEAATLPIEYCNIHNE